MKAAARIRLVLATGVVVALTGCGPGTSAQSDGGVTGTKPVASRATPVSSASSAMTAPSSAASAPSAMEVLAKAEARAKTIRSCAYEEQFTDGKDPLKVSFRGSRTDYEINLQVGSAEATFIVHGDTSYTRGNAAFWSKVKGRNPGKDIFVQVPTSQLGPATRLTLDRTLRKLIALAKSRALPVVSDGEAAGISAWTLIDKAGARAGTFSVSKDTFDVLRVSSGNREFGAFTFSGWNDTFDIPTPPRSLVVKGRTAPAREASASASA